MYREANLTALARNSAPISLVDVSNAGATLSKLLFPGTYTVTLPTIGSGSVANITSSNNAIGAVFAPKIEWGGVLLDFAAVGGADETLAVEIGRVGASGAMAQVMASVSLKSITTSGTIANTNPFTGVATASTTWRLFDLVTTTSKAQLGQVLTNIGGSEDNTPSQLLLDVGESPFYYVLVTSLGALTRAICVMTPQGGAL